MLNLCCPAVCVCAALACLSDKASITREFSLHMLAARTQAARLANPDFTAACGMAPCTALLTVDSHNCVVWFWLSCMNWGEWLHTALAFVVWMMRWVSSLHLNASMGRAVEVKSLRDLAPHLRSPVLACLCQQLTRE